MQPASPACTSTTSSDVYCRDNGLALKPLRSSILKQTCWTSWKTQRNYWLAPKWKWQLLSRVWLFATPWTVATTSFLWRQDCWVKLRHSSQAVHTEDLRYPLIPAKAGEAAGAGRSEQSPGTERAHKLRDSLYSVWMVPLRHGNGAAVA